MQCLTRSVVSLMLLRKKMTIMKNPDGPQNIYTWRVQYIQGYTKYNPIIILVIVFLHRQRKRMSGKVKKMPRHLNCNFSNDFNSFYFGRKLFVLFFEGPHMAMLAVATGCILVNYL